jgi:hypothetical protein
MWVWLVEKLNLYLFSLSLKVSDFFLQLHGAFLILVLLVDGRVLRFLLILKVEIVIQVIVIAFAAVVGAFVGALGDLVEAGVDEGAEIDCVGREVPSISFLLLAGR